MKTAELKELGAEELAKKIAAAKAELQAMKLKQFGICYISYRGHSTLLL